MIPEKNRVILEDGSFYFYELINAEVFEKDELLGKVLSVQNYGSGDLINVKHNDKEILIPLNKEFIKKIDIANKRVEVELIDGFLN
jgi:16S rRNA processing protein RimM